MNSPLLLLLFLAVLLAYPLYAVLTNQKRAKNGLAKLVAEGFRPTETFHMTDMIISVDKVGCRVAFIDFDHFIIPRGMSPPVDRGSFSIRKTEVVDFNDLERLEVRIGTTQTIEIVLHYNAPNRINSTKKLGISLVSNDLRRVEKFAATLPSELVSVLRDA